MIGWPMPMRNGGDKNRNGGMEATRWKGRGDSEGGKVRGEECVRTVYMSGRATFRPRGRLACL